MCPVKAPNRTFPSCLIIMMIYSWFARSAGDNVGPEIVGGRSCGTDPLICGPTTKSR